MGWEVVFVVAGELCSREFWHWEAWSETNSCPGVGLALAAQDTAHRSALSRFPELPRPQLPPGPGHLCPHAPPSVPGPALHVFRV